MKTNLHRKDPRRGSALLAAMIVIVILSFAAAGILSYSLNTYRNSVRQAMLDQGKEIADSEMDFLYYTWKGYLLAKQPVANIQGDMSAVLGSGLQPQAATFQNSNTPWTVSRSLQFAFINGTTDGGSTGILPGTTSIGRNYYYTVETSATVNMPLFGTVTYKSGRHFVYSNTSLFQYAVFYQGNLEMAAGGDMTISGPVSTNASAYLGAQDNGGNPFTLTLTDTVAFFQDYNGASDPNSGETDYLLQGSSTLVDPVYNPNPQAAAPTDQVAQRNLQVTKLTAQSSFIGGVDVQADVNNSAYAAAYTNLQGVVDPNEVYRAVIAPPPTTNGEPTSSDLTEDETVAGSRMYNNAGIVITVEQTLPGTPNPGVGGNVSIHVGIAPDATNPRNVANLQLYDSLFPTIVHPTGAATDVITGVRQTFVDPREALNGTTGVNLTTLDIGNLNVALNSGIMAVGSTLQSNYNGVVYIYDNSNNGSNPPGSNPALTNTLNGIRLQNATSTPAFNDQNNNPIGFTVVSNNGVYVQGDYNTNPIIVAGASVTNPAAVMGDAITALSQGWSLTANLGTTLQPMTTTAGGPREASASTTSVANPANPTVDPAVPPAIVNGMQINAAILTGNTPTNVTGGTNSGGAQNLVRMIEDWYYNPNGTPVAGVMPGLTLELNGSLGQLFTSKYFAGAYPGSGVGHNVYIQPKTRVLNYDLNFKNRTPAGSPSTTAFTRGNFFFW